jgi:hypothetical protein
MTARDWYAEWVIANYESWLAKQWRAARRMLREDR